ncbi:MAG: di-trans,poly-cis-decaprenylcistransferase [Clostridiales bacterium]|nr:di-trans,poly-cis-decaprenylcistransferase [Clostridiales bacterium]
MATNTILQGVDIPKHIAIIMDGNGRWAKKRMMPRSYGHKQGMERMIGLMERAFELGVDYITVYALSTENLKRPKEELDGLFDLFRKHFKPYLTRVCAKGVRLRAIGDISLLPEDLQQILKEAEAETAKFEGKGINVAVCYGARDELVRAVNLAVERGVKVTEESLAQLLYTHDQPDPDLIIRTGKEVRLSNFLLYQAAYAELYFSDKMFPEFSDDDLDKAILEFSRRTRRFGKTDEQL